MRRVNAASEMEAAFERATSEAAEAFGDAIAPAETEAKDETSQ